MAQGSGLKRTLLALATAGLCVGSASAQSMSTNSAQSNAGYGRVAGQESRPVEVSTRDRNGNRVIVDGVMLTGADQSVYARSDIGGAFDSYSGVGGSAGGSSAIGNNLVVVTQGNNNTVIVNSTQTNSGAVTATTTVSGKPNTNGQ